MKEHWEALGSTIHCHRCGKHLGKVEPRPYLFLCNFCGDYMEVAYTDKENGFRHNNLSENDFKGLHDWITEVLG